MQKLEVLKSLKRLLHSSQGSVLVSAVVFSIVLGITAAGYLAVTRNLATQETVALSDRKAFYAAESGLLMGTRWLADTINWQNATATGIAPFAIPTVNGCTAIVTIGPLVGDSIEVSSRVERSSSRLPYHKTHRWFAKIHWGADKVMTMQALPISINSQSRFVGPVHCNDSMSVHFFTGHSNNSLRFMKGPVSVYSFYRGSTNTLGASPWLNDYEYGISYSGTIDNLFYAVYKHSQPVRNVSARWGNFSWLANPPGDTATIQFNSDGSVLYQYGGNSTPYANLNGQVLVMPRDKSIKVSGVVNGSCSIVTLGTGGIIITGNLTYAGWNWNSAGVVVTSGAGTNATFNTSNNYGLNNNPNYLSLIAADSGDITFNIAGANGGTGPFCVVGYLYTNQGDLQLFYKRSRNPNNVADYFSPITGDVYFVGAIHCKGFGDGVGWNPENHISAFLYDQRFANGGIRQTGIDPGVFLIDEAGTYSFYCCDLSGWQETNQ